MVTWTLLAPVGPPQKASDTSSLSHIQLSHPTATIQDRSSSQLDFQVQSERVKTQRSQMLLSKQKTGTQMHVGGKRFQMKFVTFRILMANQIHLKSVLLPATGSLSNILISSSYDGLHARVSDVNKPKASIIPDEGSS